MTYGQQKLFALDPSMPQRFDAEGFERFILYNGVVGFREEPFTLASGRTSHWYVNWRRIAEDAFLTDALADYVLALAIDLGHEPTTFYGVPEGATKVALITQYKMAKASPHFQAGSHPLSMGRGKPKEHGDPKDRYFLGSPRGDTVLLEDVTTTGKSIMDAAQRLQEARIPVLAAYGLTNRDELRDDGLSVTQALASLGVPYFAMSSAHSLLPKAIALQHPSAAIVESVLREFEEYGLEPLVLR